MRTKLNLANRALWVARESSEEDPMTFIFDETLNLCEPEKFGESFASCRPATEEKKQDQEIYTRSVTIYSNCVSWIYKSYRYELNQLHHLFTVFYNSFISFGQ